jgi:CheY-like chemotaxis protein
MNSPRKVVLIDDDQDDHEIFTIALREAAPAVDCTCYDSAEIALRELTSHRSALPEYIFLDLNMPRMNGIQFLEKIKRSQLAHLPVIIYSTAVLPPDRKRLEELGAFKIYLKPNSDKELASILKKILSGN